MSKEIYITFDMEWASDEVMEYLIRLLKEYNIKSTLMVTHDTPLLGELRNSGLWELGIHPNFNKLLYGTDNRDYKNIIDDLLKIVPEAKCYRSHALTQGTLISVYIKSKDVIYDLNNYIPVESSIIPEPYASPGGGVMLPFIFEDDLLFSSEDKSFNVEAYFQKEGLKIFNFHPINIFLNTDTLERYESAKIHNHDFDKLSGFVNNTQLGSKDVLIAIIKYGQSNNFTFKLISDVTC